MVPFGGTDMTVHHIRIATLAAVLVGISALSLTPRLHAQQTLDELRALADQGAAEAQHSLGLFYENGLGQINANSGR